MKPLVCVGIDVSKAQLDVAVRPKGSLGLPHDETGIVQVVKYLQPLAPTLIVLEATGGLELPLTGALAAAGLPVVVEPGISYYGRLYHLLWFNDGFHAVA